MNERLQHIANNTELEQNNLDSHYMERQNMDVNTKDNSGDALFLHDSIKNEIEIGRLLAGYGCEGDKHRTYTIQNASEFLGTLHHARTTILHVGINDLVVVFRVKCFIW